MKKDNNKSGIIVISLLLFICITSLTIGYAQYEEILNIESTVTVYKKGRMYAEIIELKSTDRPDNTGDGMILVDEDITFEYYFTFAKKDEKSYTDTFLITLYNDSHEDYVFTGFNLKPEITLTGIDDDGGRADITYEYVPIEGSNISLQNNVIPAGERGYLGIKINIYVSAESQGTIGVGGGAEVTTSEDTSGNFYGYLEPSNPSVDLQNNNIDCFSVKVLNTYKSQKSFSITPGNSSFDFVDTNSNPLGTFTINAPSEDDPNSNIEDYTVCVKAKDSALFRSETETTSVVINPVDYASYSVGTVNISVIKAEEPDEEKVHIGNVTFEPVSFNSTSNQLTVKATWVHLPDQAEKSTSIKNYYIKLYDRNVSTTQSVYDFTVPSTALINNYTFTLSSSNYLNETNMVNNNHTYFIKVYGEDEAGNIGESDCNLDNGNDFCVKSNETSLKYKFKITVSSTSNRVTFLNNSTNVYLKETFTDILRVTANNYTLDENVTISRGNTTLTKNTDYTFGRNSGSTTQGTLIINASAVTGDITVNASSTYSSGGVCLVEGTKITLADGNKKNIEDIKYDDLLMVLSHDTGKTVYEYPIWIEDENEIKTYQINTFSDGSVLKTVGNHGIYSVDANRYVSAQDKKNFHIGTRVLKIDTNGNISIVKVTDIKVVNDRVNFYHVASTYYYNIVAENIVTTDDLLHINNMFGFNKDYTWSSKRQEFISGGDLFTFDDLKMHFAYYLYKGLRMDETKILYNANNLNIDKVDETLNSKIVPVPQNKNGINLWKITTSDNPTSNKLYEEGSIYILPKPKNVKNKKFIGWYNHSNNTYYDIGDKVEVIYGMYFEAIWT